MTPTVFETPRIVARRIAPGDAAALHAIYGDAEVVRWAGDGRPLSLAQCEEWVGVTLRNYAARGYGMFALALRNGGALVGFGGLVHPGGQAEAEIKYAFARDAWGRGYATEVATALRRHGAEALGLRHIVATVAPQNGASQRVLLKAGFALSQLRRNDDGSFTQCFEWRADRSDGH